MTIIWFAAKIILMTTNVENNYVKQQKPVKKTLSTYQSIHAGNPFLYHSGKFHSRLALTEIIELVLCWVYTRYI
jgi:hypothetical protein